MASRDVVRIDGLRELSQSLKAIEEGNQKQINAVMKSAADKVATKARGRINSRTGKLASTVKPYGTQRASGVRMGRASVPYFGSYEFGGWPKGRKFIREGRALYPTFRDSRDQVIRDISTGLQQLIDRHGL